MTLISFLTVSALLALGTWMSIKGGDEILPCPDPKGAHPLKRPECFFSNTYEDARRRFRNAAGSAKAELHSLTLECGYTIDVAVLQGVDESRTLLHISGTHGAEGFVGSAIQTGFLNYISRQNATRARTAVFVHALNPFGMAHWRRVNENNVDLNRNAHFQKAGWDEMLARDPNIAGYEEFNHMFNPASPPQFFVDDVRLIAAAVVALFSKSMDEVKRALVTGTYRNNRGIFFGGRELQESHKALRDFLSSRKFLTKTRDLIIVDVHSGIGPLGEDTLMMNEHLEQSQRIFGEDANTLGIPWKPAFALELQTLGLGEENHNGASVGYDAVKGDVQANYHLLFPNLDSFVSVTQEFGTVSGLLVVSVAFLRV